MVNPAVFNDYDKISDDVYILGRNAILRFNVSLSHKAKDGTRYNFHNEYQYESEKYNGQSLITIRRTFDYFLSIENMKPNEYSYKEFIMITVKDMIDTRIALQRASRWFTSNEFANLFANDKGKLVILGKPEPIYIRNLPQDKYIALEPIVINYEEHYSTGIRLYMSNPNNYVDMSTDKLFGLIYIMESFNMYQSAQLMLNYLQRPEFGTNLYQINNTINPSEKGFVQADTNRRVKSQTRNKTFFEKMNELE